MKILISLLVLALLLWVLKDRLFSFRAQTPEGYVNLGPEMALKTHLSGPIQSEGLIYGPTGRVTSTFVARMFGEWEGNTGTLTEDFTYSNGRTQSRKWYLRAGEGNQFTATADDIIGTAHGTVSGATISLRYTIVLPSDVGGHKLDVTDWMYLTEDGVIMNRSEMRMFGFKVGELIATMRPDRNP